MDAKKINNIFTKLRIHAQFLNREFAYFLPLVRQKGWRWTWRHAKLCRHVYLPWLKKKLASTSKGFDREFYIAKYVRGPLLIDPLEHYVRRGMYYGLKPNAAFDPYRYPPSNMHPGDRRAPLLHHILAQEKGVTLLPYPLAAYRPGVAEKCTRVHNFFITCSKSGLRFPPGKKILDFGCGDGHMVVALRAFGFDAYGYDLEPRIAPQYAPFREFFRDGMGAVDAERGHAGVSNYQLKSGKWHLPYPSDTFDIVFSQQVIEHVFDLDIAFAEMARVLKPGGISLHVYPPKNCFMERHVHVPLGHRLHFRWYFYLWFLLSKNNSIKGDTAFDRASHAYDFVDTATCYTYNNDMKKLAAKYFSEVRLICSYPPPVPFNPFLMFYNRIFPHTMLLACRK
ncbi:MAG: class I SAM-dependent methyltransferase [Desulfovibrio sp.]|uniref:class I SAM-dependent methyltransferase n=1 Tax=Desulfovibrio sp. TaxID=885 RepID=UPI001A6B6536|nr:class I SAM-dependent methyltransferase [Desulfovibrio sp.]MBD5417271.1 class I SAM-dependent methyltransferase [Desulfovibrio sp.]